MVGSTYAAGFHGLETMRMAYNGNVGIGNFYNDVNYTFTKTPARRLEVLTDRLAVAPQFRLTYDQQDPANPTTTGRFGDFYETSTGDLGIVVQDNTLVNNSSKNFKERFVGINTNTPGNTLEINSQYVAHTTLNGQPASTFGAPTGWAGLRFSDLRSTSIPQANPNTTSNGVLSVDANGDVIYVPGGGGGVGNICGGTPNPLPAPGWEVPMNTHNFWFAGNGGPNQDRVGIGFVPGSCASLSARLHVEQNSGTTNDITIFSANSVMDGIAFKASATGNASAAQTKVAGWFETTPAAGAQQVAIYVPAGRGLVNLGYPSPSSGSGELLNVNGGADFEGNVYPTTTGTWRCGRSGNEWFEIWANNTVIQTSDERKKTNIKPLEYGLKEIMQMNPVTFNWKSNPDYGTNIGLIAQQLREVVKEVVMEGDDENKSLGVKYSDLIPVLIKGIQEQQAQIEKQEQANQNLQQQVNELKAMINAAGQRSGANATSVNLSDKNVVVLNQNIPNPFSENTVISYVLPETFTNARIVFSTQDGQLLKSVNLETPGHGELTVFASDISKGIYQYSLIVDGKVIETKKMVKQ
jgi:hypothetical protein